MKFLILGSNDEMLIKIYKIVSCMTFAYDSYLRTNNASKIYLFLYLKTHSSRLCRNFLPLPEI